MSRIGTAARPGYGALRGVSIDAGGTIYATDIVNNVVFKIDPSTGNRFILAGGGVGGTTFSNLDIGITVYNFVAPTVPEPSSLALATISVATSLGFWLRRRRNSTTASKDRR